VVVARDWANMRRVSEGFPGVLQGTYSYVLQDEAGQVSATHSVSAGWIIRDWAGAMPGEGQAAPSTFRASDRKLSRPAPCWRERKAVFRAGIRARRRGSDKRAPGMTKSDVVIVNISGRGDKDIGIFAGEPKVGLN